jgi:hypothetical protein
MADAKINPVFEGFSRQIGDLVFVHSNGKTFVRRKGNPGNPKTAKQLSVRKTLSELVIDWSSLDGMMHMGWKQWSAKKKKKGNNVFVGENFEKQRAGLPIQLFRPVGKLKLTVFTAMPGASGGITCEYTIEGGGTGKYIYFFTKKRINGIAGGGITMHSGGADPVSPYTINGLEPGSEYCVYAVVTNGEYSSATEVSASIGVVAMAGV